MTVSLEARRLHAELQLLDLTLDVHQLAAAQTVAPREPFPHETAARVDFAGIAADLDTVAARVAGISLATRAAVLGRLQQLVNGADSPAAALGVLNHLELAGLSGVPGATQLIGVATTAIHADLVDTADRAATRVHAEAINQGVPLERIDTSTRVSDATTEQLAGQAQRVAAATAAQLVDAARQTAAAAAAPGRTVADVAAAITDTAAGLSDRAVEDVANQAVNRAGGLGRVDGARGVAAPVTIYASELIDSRTCYPCDLVDGSVYETELDALQDYPAGQYDGCLGGPRCRGMLVYVWAPESPATVGMPT